MNDAGIIGNTVILKNNLKAIILDKIIVKDANRFYTGPSYSQKEHVLPFSITNYLANVFTRKPKIKKDEHGCWHEDYNDFEIKEVIMTISPEQIKRILNDK